MLDTGNVFVGHRPNFLVIRDDMLHIGDTLFIIGNTFSFVGSYIIFVFRDTSFIVGGTLFLIGAFVLSFTTLRFAAEGRRGETGKLHVSGYRHGKILPEVSMEASPCVQSHQAHTQSFGTICWLDVKSSVRSTLLWTSSSGGSSFPSSFFDNFTPGSRIKNCTAIELADRG